MIKKIINMLKGSLNTDMVAGSYADNGGFEVFLIPKDKRGYWDDGVGVKLFRKGMSTISFQITPTEALDIASMLIKASERVFEDEHKKPLQEILKIKGDEK